MGDLTGRTAIVTGGGRAAPDDGTRGSIGYGIATAFAKEGANLVLTGRTVQKLTDAKDELERLYGVRVPAVQATSARARTMKQSSKMWYGRRGRVRPY